MSQAKRVARSQKSMFSSFQVFRYIYAEFFFAITNCNSITNKTLKFSSSLMPGSRFFRNPKYHKAGSKTLEAGISGFQIEIMH